MDRIELLSTLLLYYSPSSSISTPSHSPSRAMRPCQNARQSSTRPHAGRSPTNPLDALHSPVAVLEPAHSPSRLPYQHCLQGKARSLPSLLRLRVESCPTRPPAPLWKAILGFSDLRKLVAGLDVAGLDRVTRSAQKVGMRLLMRPRSTVPHNSHFEGAALFAKKDFIAEVLPLCRATSRHLGDTDAMNLITRSEIEQHGSFLPSVLTLRDKYTDTPDSEV